MTIPDMLAGLLTVAPDADGATALTLLCDAHMMQCARSREVSASFTSDAASISGAFIGHCLHSEATAARREIIRDNPNRNAERLKIDQALGLHLELPGFRQVSAMPDEIEKIAQFVAEFWSDFHAGIQLHINFISGTSGLPYYPTLDLYTAVVAEKLGFPVGSEPILGLVARTPIWAGIWLEQNAAGGQA